MRAVIQRVTRASVTVNGGEPRAIGPGLVILLGVRDTDDSAIVPKLAEKCAHLRIFEDEDGKLNRSAVELGYSALVVSNFTLYGDTSRGYAGCSLRPPLNFAYFFHSSVSMTMVTGPSFTRSIFMSAPNSPCCRSLRP